MMRCLLCCQEIEKLGFNSLGIVLNMIFVLIEKSPDLSYWNYQRYYRLNGVYNKDPSTPLRVDGRSVWHTILCQ